jgi:hypothetical protein
MPKPVAQWKSNLFDDEEEKNPSKVSMMMGRPMPPPADPSKVKNTNDSAKEMKEGPEN